MTTSPTTESSPSYRVALVHSFYGSEMPSGENVAVVAQAEALEQFGHRVEIIAAHTDDEAAKPLHRTRAALRTATSRGRDPLRTIAAFGPDVVHVHNLFPNWSQNWVTSIETPLVATVHNYRPVCAAATLYRDEGPCNLCPTSGSMNAVRHRCYRSSALASIPLAIHSRRAGAENTLWKRADRLIFLSQTQQRLFESFGLPTAKAVVIPNFADVPCQPEREQLDRQGCIFVGRLSEQKGIRQLLDLWTPDMPPLTVIGDGPLVNRVQHTAGNAANIHYAGSLTRSETLERMAHALCLLFPTRSAEPFGLVYVEALSVGLPVIAWQPSAAADLVQQDGTGRSVTWESDLSTSILSTIAEAGWLRDSCRRVFAAKYTPATFASSVTSVYASAMAHDRPSRDSRTQ